jgi:hypothetical protein
MRDYILWLVFGDWRRSLVFLAAILMDIIYMYHIFGVL